MIRRVFVAAVVAVICGLFVPFQPALTFPSSAHRLGLLLFHATSPAQSPAFTLPTPVPTPLPTPIPPPPPLSSSTTVLAYAAPPIQARAAYLVDMKTGQLLYSKNPDTRLPMASTTKITTAVLALEHSYLSDLVTVSQRAASIGESTMGLQKGERLTVRQLLYGLLLNSGNDAAIVLAEHVAGSVKRFVRMMNQLAKGLHMRNTHYVTPHGLDEPGHYSSARDLATIATYAMRDSTFRRIVDTESYYVPPSRHNSAHWLASVNQVLFWYPGVDGVKPGNTDNAGLCQVVTDWRNGHHILAVLLNTPNLITDVRNLLDYGSDDFQWVQGPAWWDAPTASISGGSGQATWRYYLGAGHYIRGLFLAYFDTHGGLRTLGYPRTEEILEDGQWVQYFQGGELVYDAGHHSVYPADLGLTLGSRLLSRRVSGAGYFAVAPSVRSLYRSLGGRGVFGWPLSGPLMQLGRQVQIFQYGELASVNGESFVVPLGDADLRLKGWLPGDGAADSYPTTMLPGLVSWINPLTGVARPRSVRLGSISRHPSSAMR